MSNFIPRHIGPDAKEREAMLAKIGVTSVDELINKTIPQHIRLAAPLDIEPGMSENDYLEHVNELAQKNKSIQVFHWTWIQRNDRTFCDLEKCSRESGMVHSLHTISGRDLSRTFGSFT